MTKQEAERILEHLVGPGRYMIQPRGGLWIWHQFEGFDFPHSNWIYLGNMEDEDIQQMLVDCRELLKVSSDEGVSNASD